MHFWAYVIFAFVIGSCVGSFLNVVVWRLPRVEVPAGTGLWRSMLLTLEHLSNPPSHCPNCKQHIRWYDNIPVIGWIKLGGRCRFCKQPISIRYPIVEAITGGLFAFYFVMFFRVMPPCAAWGPVMEVDAWGSLRAVAPVPGHLLNWPEDRGVYAVYMTLVAALLAASLIDAESFIIPIEIPWVLAIVGVVFHAIADEPRKSWALSASPAAGAIAAGAGVGLVVSILAWLRGWIPQSFPDGEPLLEVDRAAIAAEMEEAKRAGKTLEYEGKLPPVYSRGQVRAEIGKEMLFLLPPMVLGAVWMLVCLHVSAVNGMWMRVMAHASVSGLLGAVLGALVGGFVVWLTRILGTLGFGRVAMGMGDVHLMFGVGAIIGGGATTVAFFLAPFFGILVAIYMMISRTRRELPYGPYLSLAVCFVLLCYCPIYWWLAPGVAGLASIVRQMVGGA
jgi:leader peptidase (prepilin peptidase)/N-methyltransferase